MLKGEHEDRRTGQQVVRRTKGQENWTGVTVYSLIWIPIDVNVLHPDVIVLQLIYSADNVQIAP